jgi:hypothetical protein
MDNFKEWLQSSVASKKRAADWLEKTSVAAIAVGIFNGQVIGVFVCLVALFATFWLTRIIEEEEKTK